MLKQTYTCIPKSANDVRLQAKLGSKNPTGLPVGVVSEDYKVGTVIRAKYVYNDGTGEEELKELNYAIRQHSVKVLKVKKGNKICFGGHLKGNVLLPDKNYRNTNKTSMVIHMGYGKHYFLFTGDIYGSNERSLVKKKKLKVTVLQVAHHGSYTSSCSEFLKKIKPKYAIIFCGKENPYGHPRPETLRRLKKYAKRVYRTDQNGTITFHSNGKRLTVKLHD